MKITLEHSILLKALTAAARVVDKKNMIPVLNNIMFDARGDVVTISANNLDIELVQHIMGEVVVSGVITIPGQMLRDFVAKLPKGCQVNLETNDKGAVAVKAGRARMSLNTIEANDFPVFTEFTPAYSVVMEVEKLKTLLDSIKHCISNEEVRYYLNGIYLTPCEGMMRAVATNGHILGVNEQSPQQAVEGEPLGVIIPRHTVGELISMAGEMKEGGLTLKMSANQISLESNSVVFKSKLIDGIFPDYERILPKNNDKIAFIDKADLAAALDRVSSVSSERGRAVKFSFTSKTLTLSVVNPDAGTATEDLGVDYDGGDLEIGFNCKYIEQHLSSIAGDVVRFCMADSGSATIITGETNRDTDFRIAMPMRV